jgi:CheY-like chemotaxis protein
MQFENKMNTPMSTPQRKAMVVDEDKDRYVRKDRNEMLKQAGYKVYPVLRMLDARGRCRPGAFDLIVVNAGENANAALEVCDHVRNCDPNQKVLLVASENAGLPERDYIVPNWDEVAKRLESSREEHSKPEMVAA